MVPRIGITMGDPAGIGSEITAKMLLSGDIQKFCTPVVFGDAGVSRQGFNLIGAEPDFGIVVDLDQALEAGRSYVYDLDNLSPDDYALGQISAEAGRAAGAAEFFAAFLEEMGLRPRQDIHRTGSCGASDRALFVCGSNSEHSRSFCQRWRERGWPLFRMPRGLFKGKAQQNRLLQDWASESVVALQQHRQFMVAIDRPLRREPETSERLARHLGAVVQRILEREPVACIFAEGGSTAATLVRQFGWQQLSVQQELGTGIVCVRAVEGAAPWLTIKPGSYAWPDRIVNL